MTQTGGSHWIRWHRTMPTIQLNVISGYERTHLTHQKPNAIMTANRTRIHSINTEIYDDRVFEPAETINMLNPGNTANVGVNSSLLEDNVPVTTDAISSERTTTVAIVA